MKLISMKDFVLKQKEQLHEDETGFLNDRLKNIFNYANFLNQPLTLGMFVPCDEDGNVLEVCKQKDVCSKSLSGNCICPKSDKYQQAKERVLFEGVKLVTDDNTFASHLESEKGFWRYTDNIFGNIEELCKYDLNLTESALKQIGL